MVVHTTKSMESVITSEGSVPVYQSVRLRILEGGNLFFLIMFDGHARFAVLCVLRENTLGREHSSGTCETHWVGNTQVEQLKHIGQGTIK